MSDEKLVPAVDPRAAKDPLLPRVAKLGRQLKTFWTFLWFIAYPEAFKLDESQLVQINELNSDWESSQLSQVLEETQSLQDSFAPHSYGTHWYPAALPQRLHWLLGRAKELVGQVADATDLELVQIARDLRNVERQISLAGVDPTAACKSPKLPEHEQYEREQETAASEERAARRAEWPEPKIYPYPSPHERSMTVAEMVEMKEELLDVISQGGKRYIDEDADGPYGKYRWRHNGEVIDKTMPARAWRMCKFLWERPDHQASFDELKVPVYDDSERTADENAYGSMRREANKFFEDNKVPHRVSLKKGTVSLTVAK